MVSLILDAGLTWVGTYLEASFSGVTVILRILNSAIAFGISALLFAMIFKLLPAVPLTWRDVGMGAAMTALLFTAGKFVIGYYIGKSGVASAYGAAASIITLLLWIYYSSLILLFGAELTKAYAENRGSRRETAQGGGASGRKLATASGRRSQLPDEQASASRCGGSRLRRLERLSL